MVTINNEIVYHIILGDFFIFVLIISIIQIVINASESEKRTLLNLGLKNVLVTNRSNGPSEIIANLILEQIKI